MRYAPSTLHFQHAYAKGPRTAPPPGAIEWEELPSLAGRIAAATGAPWDATRPADLDAGAPSQPFREPVHGVAMREVHEPDVFRHFFGTV